MFYSKHDPSLILELITSIIDVLEGVKERKILNFTFDIGHFLNIIRNKARPTRIKMIEQRLLKPANCEPIKALNAVTKFESCVFCNRKAIIVLSAISNGEHCKSSIYIMSCNEHILNAAKDRQDWIDTVFEFENNESNESNNGQSRSIR